MKSLEKLAVQRNLTIRECGNGHVQILGGTCLVNYYPDSKRRSAYIAGATGRARHGVTPGQAVEMAFESAPPGWAAKPELDSTFTRRLLDSTQDEPSKRTIADWIRLLPGMRFAWKKVGL